MTPFLWIPSVTASSSPFSQEEQSGKILFLDDRLRGATDQMAVDCDLMDRMGDGWGGLLRTYRFSGPSVTIGRTFCGDLPSSWLALNPEIAVRPTGGGAVLHQDDLCFSFFLAPRPSFPPKLFYRIFHGWVNRFLGTLSVAASCTDQCISERQTAHGVCFEKAVPGDLVSGVRKVMGGALRISGRNLLYQGSLAVPGYRGDALSAAFRRWYPEGGSRMLREELSSGPCSGMVRENPPVKGIMSCYG